MKKLLFVLVALLLAGVLFAETEVVEEVEGGWSILEVQTDQPETIYALGVEGEEQGTALFGVISSTMVTIVDFGVPMGVSGEVRALDISGPFGPITGDMGVVDGSTTGLYFQGNLALNLLVLPAATSASYGEGATVVFTAKDSRGRTQKVTIAGATEPGFNTAMLRYTSRFVDAAD